MHTTKAQVWVEEYLHTPSRPNLSVREERGSEAEAIPTTLQILQMREKSEIPAWNLHTIPRPSSSQHSHDDDWAIPALQTCDMCNKYGAIWCLLDRASLYGSVCDKRRFILITPVLLILN